MVGSRVGAYLVGARIGTGGGAAVHLGLRVEPDGERAAGEIVAVKVIHEHLAADEEFVRMFHDEAKLSLRLKHPNIVHTYELGEEAGRLYMALEYLHGHSLHELLARCKKTNTVLPVWLVASLGARIAGALHCAHSLTDEEGWPLQLVHRDVSPRNIFVSYDGSVKLIDFGIAHAAGRLAQTKVGHVKGTFTYIAPERVLGGACDHRADVFSLACVLFEASTGQRLFPGKDDAQTLRNVLDARVPDPRKVRAGFPDAVAETLLKGLALQPDHRHETAAAFAAELEAFVQEGGLGNPRAQLSAVMRTLFAEDRVLKEREVDEMRNLGVPAEDVTAETLVPGSTRSLATRSGRAKWRWLAAATAGGGAACAAALVFFTARDPRPVQAASPSASASSPVNASVVLAIEVEPAADALFLCDGDELRGSVAEFLRPVADEPVDVRVVAAGYEEVTLAVVPDRDRTITVPLRKTVVPAKAYASAQVTAEPAGRRIPKRRKAAHGRSAPVQEVRGDRPAANDLLDRRH